MKGPSQREELLRPISDRWLRKVKSLPIVSRKHKRTGEKEEKRKIKCTVGYLKRTIGKETEKFQDVKQSKKSRASSSSSTEKLPDAKQSRKGRTSASSSKDFNKRKFLKLLKKHTGAKFTDVPKEPYSHDTKAAKFEFFTWMKRQKGLKHGTRNVKHVSGTTSKIGQHKKGTVCFSCFVWLPPKANAEVQTNLNQKQIDNLLTSPTSKHTLEFQVQDHWVRWRTVEDRYQNLSQDHNGLGDKHRCVVQENVELKTAIVNTAEENTELKMVIADIVEEKAELKTVNADIMEENRCLKQHMSDFKNQSVLKENELMKEKTNLQQTIIRLQQELLDKKQSNPEDDSNAIEVMEENGEHEVLIVESGKKKKKKKKGNKRRFKIHSPLKLFRKIQRWAKKRGENVERLHRSYQSLNSQ